jgi:hypothetical protein
MPRTRVHNLNISLDGDAAGEHVTFDEPIGGARHLFDWLMGVPFTGLTRWMTRSRWTAVQRGHRRRPGIDTDRRAHQCKCARGGNEATDSYMNPHDAAYDARKVTVRSLASRQRQ